MTAEVIMIAIMTMIVVVLLPATWVAEGAAEEAEVDPEVVILTKTRMESSP